jgi:hypothetical protein
LCSLRRRLDLAQTAINDLVDDLFEKLAQGGVPWPFKVLMFFLGGWCMTVMNPDPAKATVTTIEKAVSKICRLNHDLIPMLGCKWVCLKHLKKSKLQIG